MWTTKPTNPTSVLIRWGLDEPMSHFATAFFARKEKGLILHQQMTSGFDINWLPKFIRSNKIVYVLEPKDLNRTDMRVLFHALMNEFSGTKYDIKGFLYFTWRAFLLKFFREPLPKKALWGDKKEPLCTGHARIIFKYKPEWFSKTITDFDIVTPGALYENMKNSNHFIDRTAEWQN